MFILVVRQNGTTRAIHTALGRDVAMHTDPERKAFQNAISNVRPDGYLELHPSERDIALTRYRDSIQAVLEFEVGGGLDSEGSIKPNVERTIRFKKCEPWSVELRLSNGDLLMEWGGSTRAQKVK